MRSGGSGLDCRVEGVGAVAGREEHVRNNQRQPKRTDKHTKNTHTSTERKEGDKCRFSLEAAKLTHTHAHVTDTWVRKRNLESYSMHKTACASMSRVDRNTLVEIALTVNKNNLRV